MNHFKTLALSTALLLTATIETQAACVTCPTINVDFSLNCTGSTGCASGSVNDSSNGTGIWMAQVKPQVKTPTSFNLNGQTAIASALSTMVMCSYNTGSSTVQLLWAPTENNTFSCSINKACPKGILCTSK